MDIPCEAVRRGSCNFCVCSDHPVVWPAPVDADQSGILLSFGGGVIRILGSLGFSGLTGCFLAGWECEQPGDALTANQRLSEQHGCAVNRRCSSRSSIRDTFALPSLVVRQGNLTGRTPAHRGVLRDTNAAPEGLILSQTAQWAANRANIQLADIRTE